MANATLTDVVCPKCGDHVTVRANVRNGQVTDFYAPVFTCNCSALPMVPKQREVYGYELDQMILTSDYEVDDAQAS